MWLLKTGDPLIEVTTAGLTVYIEFQASEPSSSGEEINFIFEPKTPAAGPFWTPRTTISINLVEVH